MTHYQWRAMKADDLSHVMEIAAPVHAGYYEAREVFAERLALFPQGCRIAAHMTPAGTEEVIGYAFMHPTRHGQPPALNRLLLELEERADCLHLHDVALLPQARGSGLGRALVEEICQLGRAIGLQRATLVAVHDSGDYWRNAGFESDDQAHLQAADAISSYGVGARYMSRTLR